MALSIFNVENFLWFSWLLLYGFVFGRQQPALFPSPWLFIMFPLLLLSNHDLRHGTHVQRPCSLLGLLLHFTTFLLFLFQFLFVLLLFCFVSPSFYFCMCVFGNHEEQGRAHVLNTLVLTGTFRSVWARVHFLFGTLK